MNPWTMDDWRDECIKLADASRMDTEHPMFGEELIEEAKHLLGLARYIAGVECERCGGIGERSYPSTATWRGGAGGQAFITDVCDACWGTGRHDKTGFNLRLNLRLLSKIAALATKSKDLRLMTECKLIFSECPQANAQRLFGISSERKNAGDSDLRGRGRR